MYVWPWLLLQVRLWDLRQRKTVYTLGAQMGTPPLSRRNATFRITPSLLKCVTKKKKRPSAFFHTKLGKYCGEWKNLTFKIHIWASRADFQRQIPQQGPGTCDVIVRQVSQDLGHARGLAACTFAGARRPCYGGGYFRKYGICCDGIR